MDYISLEIALLVFRLFLVEVYCSFSLFERKFFFFRLYFFVALDLYTVHRLIISRWKRTALFWSFIEDLQAIYLSFFFSFQCLNSFLLVVFFCCCCCSALLLIFKSIRNYIRYEMSLSKVFVMKIAFWPGVWCISLCSTLNKVNRPLVIFNFYCLNYGISKEKCLLQLQSTNGARKETSFIAVVDGCEPKWQLKIDDRSMCDVMCTGNHKIHCNRRDVRFRMQCNVYCIIIDGRSSSNMCSCLTLSFSDFFLCLCTSAVGERFQSCCVFGMRNTSIRSLFFYIHSFFFLFMFLVLAPLCAFHMHLTAHNNAPKAIQPKIEYFACTTNTTRGGNWKVADDDVDYGNVDDDDEDDEDVGDDLSFNGMKRGWCPIREQSFNCNMTRIISPFRAFFSRLFTFHCAFCVLIWLLLQQYITFTQNYFEIVCIQPELTLVRILLDLRL